MVTAGCAADPSARFRLAEENQSAFVNGTWVWWVDALHAAVPDLNNYFDGVAVHPYGTDLSNIQTAFNYARTTWNTFVRAVFVYGYRDNNANTADPENDYGLVDFSGTTKPALAVFNANH